MLRGCSTISEPVLNKPDWKQLWSFGSSGAAFERLLISLGGDD
jgi:hypothetical protein